MKKTIQLVVVMLMMMIMFGLGNIAEARKGSTSSSSTSSSSSKSSSSSRSSSSYKSSSSSSYKPSSYSKPSSSSYTSSSKSSSSIANAAKAGQAKSAWQSFLKKDETPARPQPIRNATPLPQNNTVNLEKQLTDLRNQIKIEKKRKEANKLSQQLTAIERQIAESRRLQQRQPVVNNFPRSNSTISATTPSATTPAVANTAKPAKSGSSGVPWGLIFLIIAVVVIVILWRRSGSTPVTNYRL